MRHNNLPSCADIRLHQMFWNTDMTWGQRSRYNILFVMQTPPSVFYQECSISFRNDCRYSDHRYRSRCGVVDKPLAL